MKNSATNNVQPIKNVKSKLIDKCTSRLCRKTDGKKNRNITNPYGNALRPPPSSIQVLQGSNKFKDGLLRKGTKNSF
jgi:hypothetical protein